MATASIAGTTIKRKVQVLDASGAVKDSSLYTWSSTWRTPAGVSPTTPAVTAVDSKTWLVRAPSVGLGGLCCTLRTQGTDPVTGDVAIFDEDFNFKP